MIDTIAFTCALIVIAAIGIGFSFWLGWKAGREDARKSRKIDAAKSETEWRARGASEMRSRVVAECRHALEQAFVNVGHRDKPNT